MKYVDRPVDAGTVDIQMRHRPQAAVKEADVDPPALQLLLQTPCIPCRAHDVEEDDIRLRPSNQFQAVDSSDRVRQEGGVGVVLSEAVDVVVQGVERAGGDDAALPPCLR